MPRIRQIKKYGNSYIIALFKADMDDFKLKESDKVDIENIIILKNPAKARAESNEKASSSSAKRTKRRIGRSSENSKSSHSHNQKR